MGRLHTEKAVAAHLTRPQHLLAAWDELLPRLRRSRRVCLFTDFDGTLAPISAAPAEVRLAPEIRRLLARLAKKELVLGIVSGRSLSYLRRRFRLRGIWYAGAHGCVVGRHGQPDHFLVSANERAEMRAVIRRLSTRLANLRGIVVKAKEASVAVHYRGVSRTRCRAARQALQEILMDFPRMRVLPGKKVWELMPNASAGKWNAIRWILRQESIGRRGQKLLFYIGDDVTDEQVFRRMNGISIAVGKRTHTAARYYLRSTAEVRTLLERLLVALP